MPPNWDDIKRCPIWKVLGVTECNNCDTVVQCWGEETVLPEATKRVPEIDGVVLKPDLAKIAVILDGLSFEKVKFILNFVSSVIDRLRDGTLVEYDWPKIADELGVLDEVSRVVESFDVPEDEFYRRYPHLRRR